MTAYIVIGCWLTFLVLFAVLVHRHEERVHSIDRHPPERAPTFDERLRELGAVSDQTWRHQ